LLQESRSLRDNSILIVVVISPYHSMRDAEP